MTAPRLIGLICVAIGLYVLSFFIAAILGASFAVANLVALLAWFTAAVAIRRQWKD